MGSMVADQLEALEEMLAALEPDIRRTSGLAVIVKEGRWAYANLQALVHHEPAPSFSSRRVDMWLRFAQHLRTGFGRKVLQQGVEQRREGDGLDF
jgi:hypothetical protein